MQVIVAVSGSEAIATAMREAPRHFAVKTRQAMRDIGHTFEREFAEAHLKGPTGPDRVAARTGTLRRAFGHTVYSGGGIPQAVSMGFGPPARAAAGGALAAAHTHIEGATITPKRGRYLAIPVAHGLTRAGVPRFASPRDVPGGFFVRTKRGLFMFMPKFRKGRKVKGAGLVGRLKRLLGQRTASVQTRSDLVFKFATSVTVPARLPLDADWEKFKPRAFRRLDEAAVQATQAAWAERAQRLLPGI